MATSVADVLASTVLYNQNQIAVVSPRVAEGSVLRLFCNDGASPRHIQQEYDALELFDKSVHDVTDMSIDFLQEALNIADGVLVVDLPQQAFAGFCTAEEGPLEKLNHLSEHLQTLQQPFPLPLKSFLRGERHAASQSPSPVAMTTHARIRGYNLCHYVLQESLTYAPVLEDVRDYLVNLIAHVGCVVQEGLYMMDISHSNLIQQPDFASADHLGVVLHSPHYHAADEGVLTPWRMGLIDSSLLYDGNNAMTYPCTTLCTRPLVQFLEASGLHGASQTIESLGWLCVELALTQQAEHGGDWLLVRLMVPSSWRLRGAVPAFEDAVYAYGALPQLMADHGSTTEKEYLSMTFDRVLGDVAKYAVEVKPQLLELLDRLTDFQLEPHTIAQRAATRPEQVRLVRCTLKKHYFLTVLRTCYGRLLLTGRWDYWKVFQRILPWGHPFLFVAKQLAREYLEAHGPVLSMAPCGILVETCGEGLARLLLDMLAGHVGGGTGLLDRVLPLFDITRRVAFAAADVPLLEQQKHVQQLRGRITDPLHRGPRVVIYAL